MRQIAKVVAVSALVAPELAFAHPFHDHSSLQLASGEGVVAAFSMGLTHPWTGVDHLLALVAVAIWSLQLGGRFPKLLSLSFLGSLAVGLGFGALLGGLPAVESMIVLSLVVFGGLACTEIRLSAQLSIAVVVLFASMHGVAHGAELPQGASVLPYLLGSVTGAAAVLGLALAFATRVRTMPFRYSTAALRTVGAAIVVSSLLF